MRNSAFIRRLNRGIFYLLLILGGAFVVLPIYWMFMASFMTLGDVFSTPVNLVPPVWQPSNYVRIFVDFNKSIAQFIF